MSFGMCLAITDIFTPRLQRFFPGMGDGLIEIAIFTQVIVFKCQPFQLCITFDDLLEDVSGEEGSFTMHRHKGWLLPFLHAYNPLQANFFRSNSITLLILMAIWASRYRSLGYPV